MVKKPCEAGITLVVVIMVVAIMAIMTTVSVQTVSFQMQREKEAELIFRGEQYVEAIRLYKQKYGRYPVRMQELWEANPKVLRRKWLDPMTGDDRWGVVFQGQEGLQPGLPGGQGGGPQPTPTRTPVFQRQRESDGEKVGPIIGVYSQSTDESIKVYKGRDRYDEWKFVYEEQSPSGQPGGGRDREVPWGQRETPTPEVKPTGTPNY
jgi:type II secretory pathway pseudopilin PulG